MKYKLLIIGIVLFGAFLRFTAVNWDSFSSFHPDERNISSAVVRVHFFKELNPKFFAYGGLPIYLYRALGEMVVWITKNPEWLHDWGHIAVIGRYVSATLSTVSIGLMYAVGSMYFSVQVGLLSAFLLVVSPWAVREAHFDTTETMLVFFILLILILSKKLLAAVSEKKLSGFIFSAAIVWGLAMAAKTTSSLFGIIPLTALWLSPVHHADKTPLKRTFVKIAAKKLLLTAMLLGIAAVVFFIFSPYTVLDSKHFMESMTYESGVALGRYTVPYTLQFLHTLPYIYQLITMVWQSGLVIIFGLAGLAIMAYKLLLSIARHGGFFRASVTALAKKTIWSNNHLDLDGTRTKHASHSAPELATFLIFPLLYFAWVGTWYAKFARYNVPFLPFVTIAAAWFSSTSIKRFRMVGLAFTALLLTASFLWGMANWTIYLRPQTRLEASDWMFSHLAPDARIYTEHWNDGMPVFVPGRTFIPFNREVLSVYELPDDEKKKLYYVEKLTTGDYIILSTRRIWATMPNLKDKYPLTSRFYEKLLNGQLGYSEVATFTSYPELFGVHVNDDSAEESVQVFDHPTVRIFQNTEHLSKEELHQQLQ